MSNKIINGNGKEAVFVEHAIDYVKKLGYEVKRVRVLNYLILLSGLIILNLSLGSAFEFDDNTLITLNPNENLTIINNFINQTVNFTDEADLLFWRLDGTNAPPTSDWNMGDIGFINIGDSTVFGNLLMRFGAGIQFTNTGNNISGDGLNILYRASSEHIFKGRVGIDSDINITGDNIGINLNGVSNNITFNDSSGCIVFPRALSTNQFICKQSDSVLKLKSIDILLESGSMTIDNPSTSNVKASINLVTSATNGDIEYDGINNFTDFSSFIHTDGWFGSIFPTAFPNNLTWNSAIVPTIFLMNIPQVFMSGFLNVTGDIYTDNIRVNDFLYNQTIQKPFGSLTTTSDSITSLIEYNIYNQSSYVTYTFVNNSNWTNIKYFANTGKFQIQERGVYYFSNSWIAESSASSFADFIFKVNDVEVYNHNFRIHSAVDPIPYTISQSRQLEAFDNITVHIDGITSIIIHDGSSFTINRI